MVICLRANLPDSPGALIRMLKPISENAGNISSVIHSHEEAKEHKIPVIVRFDLPQEVMSEKLQIIQKALENLNIEITEITEMLQREHLFVIITGHVFETGFVDTYKRIKNVGGTVSNIEARFTDTDAISTVKFEIQCDQAKIDDIYLELHKICEEKNLALIADR